MDNTEQLTEVEKWQRSEEERLEYEGYCNKIRQGLEDHDEKSSERAVWELIQNARDMSDAARIKVELTEHNIIFSHHGTPFDYTSFHALVKQDSSKDRHRAEQVGQYGTGFMTTHVFNRMVYVSGPFVIKSGSNKIEGYVQIKDFELDRTMVDTEQGPAIMGKQLNEVKEFWKRDKYPSIQDDTTSFRYELTQEQVEDVSKHLQCAIRLMPFVLVINSRIQEIEIYNHNTQEHYTLRRAIGGKTITSYNNEWSEIVEQISLYNNNANNKPAEYICKSLQSDKGDVIIIPPYPISCGDVENIPSLFLWFPLLGTESFGVNFIFHSKRFNPVEKRNGIMLPGSTVTKREKGGENSLVLKEMMRLLFDYYSHEENAKTLPRQSCVVSFPKLSEDEETLNFYKEMQKMWNESIPNWKILPVGNEFFSVSDKRVKLLHPDFYTNLNVTQQKKYESILAKYALYPKQSDGNSYLMPNTELIAWSEVVSGWDCGKDEEFFITIEDVCSSINSQGDDLYTFLMLLKDGGNEKVMETHPLLPNRNGELHKKKDLYHANFMTKEIYELVQPVMGEDAKKIYDPAFLDVCEVNTYTVGDLERAITATMASWRKSALDNKEKTALTDEQLSDLIRFCSATHLSDFSNARGRLIPLIAQFYDKQFEPQHTGRFREENEEEFYGSAFGLLLDYTLYQISQKDSLWVVSNKSWLRSFLTQYSPSTNAGHSKRLDDYAVIPNQCNELCLKKDLQKNSGVPEDMAEIYQEIFNKDLHKTWVDYGFEDIDSFVENTPQNIAKEIEERLVADMKQDGGEKKYEKTVRSIIIKIGQSAQWAEWFPLIDDRKANYTFNMKSGHAQESLFALMDIEDSTLGRLAEIAKEGNINEMLNKMERQLQAERDNLARFNHLHAIGKHIEEVLRSNIGSDFVKVDNPENMAADDVQDGQDIIIRVKKGDMWEDVFYVEVKSKWDFSEPAHMSTRQVRKAVLHSNEYALCCVDLRNYRNEDLENISAEIILSNTRVKMDIGEELNPMVRTILEADKQPDADQIKISDYRSNMSAKFFEKGTTLDELLKKIEQKVRSIVI